MADLVATVELLIAAMGWNQQGRPRGPSGPSLVDDETATSLRVAVNKASLDLSEIHVNRVSPASDLGPRHGARSPGVGDPGECRLRDRRHRELRERKRRTRVDLAEDVGVPA